MVNPLTLWFRVRITTVLLVLGLIEDRPDHGWSIENG